MKHELCMGCEESDYCNSSCPESLIIISTDPKDRMRDKEYKPKGISLLSYAESRITKFNDLNKELDFN